MGVPPAISWTEPTLPNPAEAHHDKRTHHLTASGQATRLELDGVALSDTERASLAWLIGFKAHTVENIAEVIIRARRLSISSSRPPQGRDGRVKRYARSVGAPRQVQLQRGSSHSRLSCLGRRVAGGRSAHAG